jgi:lysophospholipase L1-like esterase
VEQTVIACLGDSITAGSPLWDPDPQVRVRIGAAFDERSQWQWWASQLDETLDFRNHGVYGQRTDEIAERLEDVAVGAAVLIVQGGINDVVQRRPIEDALHNLVGMVERGRQIGLAVALVDVLPWNNGDGRAANDIDELNMLIAGATESLGVRLLPFNTTLADPDRPDRMCDDMTDDGDHPSIEGHRLLGERAFRLP